MIDTSEDDAVLVIENIDAVRVLRLNRPSKLNALNSELTQALHDAFLEADADESVRALVVVGNGRAFCAGADLSEFKDLTPANQSAVLARSALTVRMQLLPQQLQKPVVAAVHGHAMGGGAGLALSCDMVLAADDVVFGYPEITHSIVPAVVMTGLQRHLPRKLAFELISCGRTLSGEQMHGYGLANAIYSREQCLPAAIELATAYATRNPQAMAATKSLFYRVAELPSAEAMQAGRDVNIIMRGFREQTS